MRGTYVRLFAGLHNQQGLGQKHHGNTANGDEHEEHLNEVLTEEHIRFAVLRRSLGGVEQNHIDESNQDGRSTCLRIGL